MEDSLLDRLPRAGSNGFSFFPAEFFYMTF